jgi:ribose-phosphate pyrophosphokinase
MTRLLIALPYNENLTSGIARRLGAEVGRAELRRFPDGETYARLLSDCAGCEVVLVAALSEPDRVLLPLVFLADAARDLGAARVGLVAPYLAYMRQDARFQPGEAVTSWSFARLLSSTFDWLVTVDPHLHRFRDLGEIYSVPTRVVHAAPLVAEWIRNNVSAPLLVGPDAESEQWVADVAGRVGAPYFVLAKTRRGDRDVEVSVPEVERWRGRTPVLVDDIISTARTMTATVRHLLRAGMTPPVCIGVHAVFAGLAHDELLASGAARVVTCNTIMHSSNAIDVSAALAAEVREIFGGGRGDS